MQLEPEACYRAMLARDPRFDGVFFVGVTTTGVYCRPICRVKAPRRSSCTFHASAALAEKAGFRACLRCRPELAPGRAPADAVPDLVRRAVRAIDAGALNERSVDELAGSLGVTDRHLRRAMEVVLGVGPVELAQSRRVALAKRLLHDTDLPLAQVAFASGFSSVRRFNALFLERFGRAPSALRASLRRGGGTDERLALVLDYRPPLDWPALTAFLAARAIPGVERVAEGRYERTVRVGGVAGEVSVEPHATRTALVARVSPALAPQLMHVVARLRALFDLDCEPAAVAAHLGGDRRLAPLVRAHPGLRVPGAFDPFETAVRAVLGQQVSVRAATTLAGRLAARGDFAAFLNGASVGEIARVGMPGARAATLKALAEAWGNGLHLLERLDGLPGVGPWTRAYVGMRALGMPDAFPASDLGVRKALGGANAKEAERLSRAWSPWRSYAVMYLWTGGAA